MSNKMINCKTCGQEIANSAKVCPNCGAKVKKPIFKKWWFWAIIVVLIICIGAASNGGNKSGNGQSTDSVNTEVSSQEISYTSYDVTELFDALKANPLKLQNDLKGSYVEIHGYLSNIDSDGSYISVGVEEGNYDYLFQTVHCNIKTSNKKDILDKVVNMNINQKITVKGKVTDVGEVLGIFVDIDSIE